jgi:hypothetical protein
MVTKRSKGMASSCGTTLWAGGGDRVAGLRRVLVILHNQVIVV